MNFIFLQWIQICNRILCRLIQLQSGYRLSNVERFILIQRKSLLISFIHKKNNLFSIFGVRTISCLGNLSFASLHTNHSDGLYTAKIKSCKHRKHTQLLLYKEMVERTFPLKIYDFESVITLNCPIICIGKQGKVLFLKLHFFHVIPTNWNLTNVCHFISRPWSSKSHIGD